MYDPRPEMPPAVNTSVKSRDVRSGDRSMPSLLTCRHVAWPDHGCRRDLGPQPAPRVKMGLLPARYRRVTFAHAKHDDGCTARGVTPVGAWSDGSRYVRGGDLDRRRPTSHVLRRG